MSANEIQSAEQGGEPPRLAPSSPEGRPASDPSGETDPSLALFIQAARDDKIDVAKLKELMALRKEVREDAAKRAFYAALASAKGEFDPILKTHLVDYVHRDERGRTTYKHEDLFDIARVVDPVLSRHGLSYRHRSTQDGAKIRVTCILSHADGHSEENSLDGFDDKTGQKSANQAITSTITFLQRATLKQALGIAAGRDTDGQGEAEPPFVMGADEIIYVETLLKDTGSDDAKFLATIGTSSIGEMTGDQYKRAIALLNEKKRRAGGAKKP